MASDFDPASKPDRPGTDGAFIERRAPRVNCGEAPVRVTIDEVDDMISAKLINISNSGVAVLVFERQLAQPGGRFQIELDVASFGTELALSCRLCYALGNNQHGRERQSWLHGASFEDLNLTALTIIDDYVRTRLDPTRQARH